MSSPPEKPTVIVTGASGFVGRNFIQSLGDDFIVYAIDMQSQKMAGVSMKSNVHWYRGDIADPENMDRVMAAIKAQGNIDFIFHFAGYYDFTNEENPEYERTNVTGTRILLEHAEKLNVKRFIFASSLTVASISRTKRIVDEESPCDAEIPYARSKRKAEELIEEYSKKFPCAIVRLAAIYSDWCEYGPLYILLKNWLSGGWMSRFLVGNGETALPYLHIHDLTRFFRQIIVKHGELADHEILIASTDGCVCHNEMFEIVSKYSFTNSHKPIYLPVFLAAIGIVGMTVLGWILRRPPFEQLWMLQYIDTQLIIDGEVSRKKLDWHPTPRYHPLRRMLFLLENMKTNPILWEQKNRIMAYRKIVEHPGMKIYQAMLDLEDEILGKAIIYLQSPDNKDLFPNYQKLDHETLRMRAGYAYELLELAILQGERQFLITYANYLARRRYGEGFPFKELSSAFQHVALQVETRLREYPPLKNMQQEIHDKIGITMQLVLDEIEEVYETLRNE